MRPVSHRVSHELPPIVLRASCLPPCFARAVYHLAHTPCYFALRCFCSLAGRKVYCPSDLPLRSIPSTHRAVVLLGGRKRYCPSDLPLRSIPPRALRLRVPAYGRGWPGSSGQHRLRPGTYPLLPTPTGAVHTQTFNQHHPPCACQHGPPTNRSLRPPSSLRLRVQLIYLPAWDYLPSYGIGPYTIVRYGTIGYRTDSLFQIANTL